MTSAQLFAEGSGFVPVQQLSFARRLLLGKWRKVTDRSVKSRNGYRRTVRSPSNPAREFKETVRQLDNTRRVRERTRIQFYLE